MLKKNNVTGILLSLFLFTFVFHDVSIRIPIVELIAFALTLVIIGFALERLVLTKLLVCCLILVVLQILATVEYFRHDYFGPSNFLNNVIRFLNINISSSLIARHLVSNKTRSFKAFSTLQNLLLFVCLFALVEIALKGMGLKVNFQIAGLTSISQARSASVFRSYFVFSEPSFLALSINTTLFVMGLINEFRNLNVKLSRWFIAVVTLGIISTFSLGQLPIYAMIIYRFRNSLFQKFNRSYGVILLAILLPMISAFGFFTRVLSTVEGSDGSSNTRIFGMWDLAKAYSDEISLLGVGLGQKKLFISHGRTVRSDFYWFDGVSSGINNTFLEIFISFGLFGLLFFSLILFSSLWKDKISLMIIILIYFSGSQMNNLAVWFMIYMTSYVNKKNQAVDISCKQVIA